MLPVLRAAADQLILDVAMVGYVSAPLLAGPDSRADPGCANLAAIVAHLASYLDGFASALGQFLDGGPTSAVSCDWAPPGTHTSASWPLADSVPALNRARDAVVEAMARAQPGRIQGEWDAQPAPIVVASASAHISHHAVDLVEALPGLREDGFFLNWALWPGRHDPMTVQARRTSLLSGLRAQSANHEEGSSL